jgi:ubiquinone/menaquinone biosynthesis C-methylase UbiE
MPLTGQDGNVVLDYGCGPGNDLVGFWEYSRPAKLIGVDVSTAAIEQAKKRLNLHNAAVDFVVVRPGDNSLPIPDNSVDYIHCSGVIMLIHSPDVLLGEFMRILKPGGHLRIMTYNKSSLWYHLYAAYIIQIEQGLYRSNTIDEVFARSTDGENCPHVAVWTPSDFTDMLSKAGFNAKFDGAAASLFEMSIASRRFEALMSEKLNSSSRVFLQQITIDECGIPYFGEHVAGIDAVYSAHK